MNWSSISPGTRITLAAAAAGAGARFAASAAGAGLEMGDAAAGELDADEEVGADAGADDADSACWLDAVAEAATSGAADPATDSADLALTVSGAAATGAVFAGEVTSAAVASENSSAYSIFPGPLLTPNYPSNLISC